MIAVMRYVSYCCHCHNCRDSCCLLHVEDITNDIAKSPTPMCAYIVTLVVCACVGALASVFVCCHLVLVRDSCAHVAHVSHVSHVLLNLCGMLVG